MNTMQYEFDAVVKHMLTQNKKSFIEPGAMCMYRGSAGLMCAVGCRIPNSMYSPLMDTSNGIGTDIYALVKKASRGDFEIPKEIVAYMGMFTRLQLIHDDVVIEDWEYNLKDLAVELGLNYNGVQ